MSGFLIEYIEDQIELIKILEEKGMPSYTEKTIIDRQLFFKELSKIRVEGIAIDREEIEVGLTCYAVPIFNYTGRAIGAVSLGGPTFRMEENHEQICDLLKDTAMQISRWLGFVPNMRTAF